MDDREGERELYGMIARLHAGEGFFDRSTLAEVLTWAANDAQASGQPIELTPEIARLIAADLRGELKQPRRPNVPLGARIEREAAVRKFWRRRKDGEPRKVLIHEIAKELGVSERHFEDMTNKLDTFRKTTPS